MSRMTGKVPYCTDCETYYSIQGPDCDCGRSGYAAREIREAVEHYFGNVTWNRSSEKRRKEFFKRCIEIIGDYS